MPGEHNGSRGGKREKRRLRLFSANLESERWTLSDIRPSKSIRCYRFETEVGAAQQRASSSSTSHTAVLLPLSPPPAPFPEAVSVERYVSELTPIALDFHNCLDDGRVDGYIPAKHVRAVRALIAASFVPCILSYIGNDGQDSEHRRTRLEVARRSLANLLGYTTDCGSEPVAGKIFAHVCNRRLFSERWQSGGKAECLVRFGTDILLDDNRAICREVTEWGLLAYNVPHQNFSDIVAQVIEDSRGAALERKLQESWQNRIQ